MTKNKRIFGLSERKQQQFEEEYERRAKEAGVADNRRPDFSGIIPPEPKIIMPDLGDLRTKATGPGYRQTELKEKDFEYYLAEWENNNRDYELTHLSRGTIIEPQRESIYNLPLEFVDFLIDEATKSDMREDGRHFLFSILRNLKKVLIYNVAGTIQIGLRDNENRLIRLDFLARSPFEFLQISMAG